MKMNKGPFDDEIARLRVVAERQESTILHEACLKSTVECVDHILRSGLVANANVTNSFGYSALWHCVHNNILDCALVLLMHGANPNIQRHGSYLLDQVQGWEHDMYALLIDFGATQEDVDRVDETNRKIRWVRNKTRFWTLVLLGIGRLRNVPRYAKQDMNVYRLIGKQMWSQRLSKIKKRGT